MDPLRRLEEMFSHFPGIGPRQAKRFVYYILSRPTNTARELTQLIDEVRKMSNECSLCHRFYVVRNSGIPKPAPNGNYSEPICNICADKNRDSSKLLIVARDSDFESIEKSSAYNGLYFVLGGTIPILDKEPEKRIRLKYLLERLNGATNLAEIILSLNTTPEGENTAVIVKEAILSFYSSKTDNNTSSKPSITILGRGLSTGAELEYADSETIKNALLNRK